MDSDSNVTKVPAAVQDVLDEHAEAIRASAKRTIVSLIDIGRRLSVVKRAVGRGHWLSCIEREFRWSEDTAERLMTLHSLQQRIPEIAEVSIPISGLYLLAAPSTPVKTAKEVVAKVQGGDRVSVAEIRTTIAGAKSASVRSSPAPMMTVDQAEKAFAKAAAERSRSKLPSYIPSAPPSAPEPAHDRMLDLAKVERVIGMFQQLTEPEKGQCVHRLRQVYPALVTQPMLKDAEVVF
jgi:Protein of unknown function (DUF3102)